MKYEQRIVLKNGKEALIRNGNASDGLAVYEVFNLTHAETKKRKVQMKQSLLPSLTERSQGLPGSRL